MKDEKITYIGGYPEIQIDGVTLKRNEETKVSRRLAEAVRDDERFKSSVPPTPKKKEETPPAAPATGANE